MPGGLLQLSAYGSASTYLHADPQVTYWKQVWRRATAFALESIEMPWSGSAPNFGVKVTAPLSKGADMAWKAWLEITLPDLADYSTTLVTATSTQPLIQRAYIEDTYIRLRVKKPSTGSSWTWYAVKVYLNGVFSGYAKSAGIATNNTTNPLIQINDGTLGYTDFTINKTDLPEAFTTTTTVTLTATAMTENTGSASYSSESQQRTVLNLKWCNSVGHALLDTVEWEIGGTRIDYIPNPDFFDVWSELTEKEEHRAGFNSMVGKYDSYSIWSDSTSNRKQKTYYVPLVFSFCQSPSQSIPIISLQYHESRINVSFRQYQQLVKSNLPVSQLLGPDGLPLSLTSCQLYVDMVYLDTEERRRMSSMEHEQLISTVQYLGDYNIAPNDPGLVKKIPLDGIMHPVKELIFVYQGWQRYQTDAVAGNDWFNYQLSADATEDAIKTVRLTLNGTERMPPRVGQYFRQVQPYQHHTRIPTKYVYCYNFGLEPESPKPTGSCNFSRLEQASLNVTLSPNVDPNGGKIKVFALSYNVLRYAQGLAGLAFSSG